MVLQLFVLSEMGNLAAKYWNEHNTLLVMLSVILTLCLNNHH